MPQQPDFVQHSQTSVRTPLRYAYFGTPDFSTLVLEKLATSGYTPTLIVTAPDKPVGRGLILTPPPVKIWAVAQNIQVLQPATFDDATVHALQGFEFAIVAAYGKILPQRVLDLFPRGMLNVHPSLLPHYRGTSPVENQILADENAVGVSVILMDALMDHGPVVARERVDIPGWPVSRNAANDILWHKGGKLLVDTLPQWLAGHITPIVQDETQATVTKKIKKEDGEIDLNGDARTNYLKYLAYDGWPGTYFFSPSAEGNKRVKITAASFANGKFAIERVIPEGKREMRYADFMRV